MGIEIVLLPKWTSDLELKAMASCEILCTVYPLAISGDKDNDQIAKTAGWGETAKHEMHIKLALYTNVVQYQYIISYFNLMSNMLYPISIAMQ